MTKSRVALNEQTISFIHCIIAKHLHPDQFCSVLPTFTYDVQAYHVNLNSVINGFVTHILEGRKC